MRPTLLSTGFGLAMLALWEFLVWVTDYPPAILPAPSVILETMFHHRDLLLANIPPTAGVALGGFFIAAVAGVAIAVAMTWSRYLKEAFYPNIIAFQIVPKIAWAPMFILWLGIDTESRLGFATFISIFPIIISMTTGLRNTDRSMLMLCRSLTASKWQMLVHVRFPYALPFLFSAMKISITLAMIGVIVAEFITSQRGLGFVILTAAGRAETDLIMAAVLVLMVIGLAFYGIVAFGTWLVDRWFGR
jgi:NitT/TauT family transport system permease protein